MYHQAAGQLKVMRDQVSLYICVPSVTSQPTSLPPYQIALVELKRQDPGTYQDSHQRAYRQACTPSKQTNKHLQVRAAGRTGGQH